MAKPLSDSQRARIEREDEILGKSAEKLTPAEWKWLEQVMGKIIKEEPRGRKQKTQHDEWIYVHNRAQVLGMKPPSPAESAGLKKPLKQDFSDEFEYKMAKDTHDVNVIRVTDAFKKAKKLRSLPPPPPKSSR